MESVSTFISRIFDTEERDCRRIDKRIMDLECEFKTLADKFLSLKSKLTLTEGFWKRHAVKVQMESTNKRIEIVRDLLETLYMARRRLTYG